MAIISGIFTAIGAAKGAVSVIKGYKTYIAAAGMLGLALYQASEGNYQEAYQTAAGAFAAAGLRHAIQGK